MFEFVEDKYFLNKARSDSSRMLKDLEELLRDEYNINSQVFLVGSGGRNLVTRNGDNGDIDFDYNLNIISCEDWNNPKEIKENVRKAFNKIMRNEGLNDVQDSTSALTTSLMWFKDNPNDRWSIDLCIVTKNNGGEWERLIHEKTGFTFMDRYYWNIAPNSKGYREKVDAIKSVPGAWDQLLRPKYLEKKNFYLRRSDHNHQSFICYVEAVNDVYNYLKP